ncbi:hypothetical protein [Ohtaekwangia koreensis]|uniref:Uncharacterized protein n=1 Tax=Ohtaekwangia koreensis TaxID=688867 RepID=A0A1T5MLQ8_9BACT|nr:hypothetical protein [Ohtaekwangia koreensis]SKC89155.1 hypothetical protein SAMN05660236_5776 [Ohtaekwangia koreensis]
MEATATRTAKSPRKKVVSPSNQTAKKGKPKRIWPKAMINLKISKATSIPGRKSGEAMKWYYDKGEWKEKNRAPPLLRNARG